ncbi:MAG: diguanylate cyclase [Pseudomonadota bacterium]
MMLIYNLLIFLVIREQLYIYYLLFNICCLFFALSVFGYGFQFIWPSSPWVSNYIVPIASYSTLITMILLTQRFLDLRKRSKALNLLLNSMIVLALLGTLLSLFVSVDNALDTLLVMMLIVILVTSFSSFYFWFRGVRIARYLALAWSGFYTCLFIFIALSFDLLPENLWTKYSIHVSILPIILLTSLGLADRINLLRQEKLLEQSKRLQLQQAFSQELEEQVVERTQALELANQALEELSNLDGLTELHNRRSFDNHLARECRRLQRHKIPLSLIMCDIDYFKKFNDTYGHQAGDACLQDVAKSIASSVRRSYDVPARYGGEEFAIILPHLGIDEAYAVAEKIKIAIEQCKIKNEASPIKPFISLSFGVASILPTGNEQDVQRLISMADQALYESKDRGRDQICRFSPV